MLCLHFILTIVYIIKYKYVGLKNIFLSQTRLKKLTIFELANVLTRFLLFSRRLLDILSLYPILNVARINIIIKIIYPNIEH